MLLFLGLITAMFGSVSGEEFSPNDFQRRSFQYYQIPFIGLQIWPLRHFDATGDLEADLLKNKLIVANPNAKPRWDLVRGQSGGSFVEDDAALLCRYLELRNKQYNLVWSDWNTKYPAQAKILWPMVQKLADQELYDFMPDIFELAESPGDPAAFNVALQSLVAKKYYDFGIYQQKLNRHAAAVELITEAIKLAPTQKNVWQKDLETSQKELPPAEAAAPSASRET